MQKLYVLYDPHCELCRRLRDWIAAQNAWLDLELIAAGSSAARSKFPQLEEMATANDLCVISDGGELYLNDRAWIMVLYALDDYRDWACRLTHPLLMPLARQAFAALSRNRHVLSHWLYESDPQALAGELRQIVIAPCVLPEGALPSPNIRDYLQ